MNTLIIFLLVINVIISSFACWQRWKSYEQFEEHNFTYNIRKVVRPFENHTGIIPPVDNVNIHVVDGNVRTPAGKYVTVEEFNSYIKDIRCLSIRFNNHIEHLHDDIPYREYIPTGNVFTPLERKTEQMEHIKS